MPILVRPASHSHQLGGVRFTALVSPSNGSTEASVWQVEISPGTDPVPHQLTREEVLVILSGDGAATLDGVSSTIGPGDAIVVPVGALFSLAAVGREPLVALAYLPVGGQACLGGGEPFTPPWAL